MIHHIRGIVTEINPQYAVVETAGIGFLLSCPQETLTGLCVGKEATLQTVYNADHHELYGFSSAEEVEAFSLLTGVSGVGPKSAMKLLNSFSVGDLMTAIRSERADVLVGRGGIGKKTALKIILELKDKAHQRGSVGTIISLDVEDALLYLGYAKADIAWALKQIPRDDMTPQEQVKEALRALSKQSSS